jgi:hypothetical protein
MSAYYSHQDIVEVILDQFHQLRYRPQYSSANQQKREWTCLAGIVLEDIGTESNSSSTIVIYNGSSCSFCINIATNPKQTSILPSCNVSP